jgi:hypothetical protein
MALRGRIGAYRLHATYDSREITAPARARFLARFLDEVDPDRVLSETERQRRAVMARKAHFARLALKSARTRGARRGQEKAAVVKTAAGEEVRRGGAESSL